MSVFNGEGRKVRCVDCSNLVNGSSCKAKDAQVSPKKRRTCTQYAFLGKYKNSQEVDTIYQRYTSPEDARRSRRVFRKLAALGITPADPAHATSARGEEPVRLVIPATTATASVLGFKRVENESQTGLWLPDKKEEADAVPDNSRS